MYIKGGVGPMEQIFSNLCSTLIIQQRLLKFCSGEGLLYELKLFIPSFKENQLMFYRPIVFCLNFFQVNFLLNTKSENGIIIINMLEDLL